MGGCLKKNYKVDLFDSDNWIQRVVDGNIDLSQ